MDHPVKNNSGSVIIYWSIPILLGLVQAVFNIFTGILPVVYALTDGLIFGSLIGLFGLAVWYVVRYNNPEENSIFQILISHLAASVVFISLWILTSGFLVKTLIRNPVYDAYIDARISGRVFEGLLFYALLACFYYLYIYGKNNLEKRRKEAELIDQLRNAQLNALRSQLNPHFLFNSLNSIASLTVTNPEKAHNMIIALSDFLRYTLQKNISEMVTLEKELQNIDLYLQIEKIRFGDKLTYHYEIADSCNKALIPNLILQPVFENAIKYGVYEMVDSVEIKLLAEKTDVGLNIMVSNTFDPNAYRTRGNGVGLKNIRERLRITYGSTNLLSVQKKDNVFTLSLTIPQ